jgi:uncharacterized heparinase superfamily protein
LLVPRVQAAAMRWAKRRTAARSANAVADVSSERTR